MTSAAFAPLPGFAQVEWRSMNQAARDAAYNNTAAVARSGAWLAQWAERSAGLRASSPGHVEAAYGAGERHRIDVMRSGRSGAPLFVFIHGGYWQRNCKETFTCMAEGLLAHGVDVALPGYTLAPDADMTRIVAEVHDAMRYLRCEATALGLSCSRLIVSGWSAGGHLAASCMALPEVDAGFAISGIFDLEPIAHTYLNAALRLSDDEIAAFSPLRHPPTGGGPLTMAWGEAELPELQRQSRQMLATCVAAGVACRGAPIAGADHFSILDGLTQPDGPLTREALALLAALP